MKRQVRLDFPLECDTTPTGRKDDTKNAPTLLGASLRFCLYELLGMAGYHEYTNQPENRRLIFWLCLRVTDCAKCAKHLTPYYGVDYYAKIRKAKARRKASH